MPLPTAGHQIVMQRNGVGQITKRSEHRVLAFLVQTVVERLGIDAPLDRDVASPSEIIISIDAPSRREVVENQMVDVIGRVSRRRKRR